MNDLHRLLEDAAPEPVRGLSADAVVTAARRRRRLRAGSVGLALALVLGGVGTAFAVTGDGGAQVLQPAETPTPTPTVTPAAATSTVLVGVQGVRLSCPYTVLVPRTVPGPPTADAALRSLFAGLTTEETAAGRVASLFSADTAGLLRSVETVDGVTAVDLDGDVRDLLAGPGGCRPAQLSEEVNRTLEAYRPYVITVDGDQAQGAELFARGAARASVRIALAGPGNDTCAETTYVVRPVEGSPTAAAALTALFAGTVYAQEKARGLGSWFDSQTADLLRSVHVVDGIAYVDLEDFRQINNVSTTCGAAAFTSQLLQTLAPYGADEVRLSIDGDPRLAADFFQTGCDDPVQPGDPCDPIPFATPSPFGSVKIAAQANGDCYSTPVTVTRDVLGPPTAEKALTLLFAGSTPAELERGLSAWESPGLLRSVHQVDDSYYVDLNENEGAQGIYSTSCGGAGFFSQVGKTLEQLGPVDAVNFAIEGDVRRFVEIAQGACAEPGDPDATVEQGFANCDPAPFLD